MKHNEQSERIDDNDVNPTGRYGGLLLSQINY